MILKHFVSTVIIGLSLVSINANGAVLKAGEGSEFLTQGNRIALKQLSFHEIPTRIFSDIGPAFNGAKKLLGKRTKASLSLVDYMNSGGLRRFQTMNPLVLAQGNADLNRLALASETVVPVPAAAWLFGSGLLGLVGMARRKARA